MPISGFVVSRIGARPIIFSGGIGLSLVLPLLPLAESPLALGAALLLFGASLGAIDVAMNVHAVVVETRESRPLMSGFHAHFSIGGFAGAAVITLLLTLGWSPFMAALFGAVVAIVAIVIAGPRLLQARSEVAESFVLPRGLVLLLAVLAGISFLVEGALLDWGALLLIERELSEARTAGSGYMLFSAAMVLMRLAGDRVVARLGAAQMLLGGGVITALGLAVILLSPWAWLALSGFVVVGLGSANLVPVLFSLAGKQKIMPPGLAIAAVTTVGYAGVLMGPVVLGFIAEQVSLAVAFWLLVVLLGAFPLTGRMAVRV
jgi:MFS family permease